MPATSSGTLATEAARVASRSVIAGALPVASLVALKLAVSAWAIHVGFTHVSDDDYARVTIAEAFAHAPHLDPTGTSWLPFPFWLAGGAMVALGRSMVVARAVAIASSVAGALTVHRALLRVGVKAWVAWTGVALAMSAPWSAWLGVATVPEALSASLVAAGAVCLGDRGARTAGAFGLLVACLSRYEAWPVAAVFGMTCLVSFGRLPSRSPGRGCELLAAALALAGPVAWLVWNGYAHGDPLHFLARVAAYRARVAPGNGGGLGLYPQAFARAGPGTLALLALGAPSLVFDRQLRKRWRAPFVAMVALAAFLIEGDLHDGAPTHHPERALVALFWLGTVFGVDGLRSLVVRFVWGRPKREAWLVGVAAAIGVARALAWPGQVADHPARSPDEDRSSEIARGEDLRARGVAHVTVTPCAYEHFALIAAFGAPERVTVATTDGSVPCGSVLEH